MKKRDMRSVANTETCYGCGGCVAACPRKCVSLRESAEGFSVPSVDAAACVSCGLCVATCPLQKPAPKVDLDHVKVFGAWARDAETLAQSSSGGVVMSLARILVSKGYRLVGVRYAPEHVRAEHFIAETLEAFRPSMGSKYLQSFTETAFRNLARDGKYLIVGTPCQIAALRPLFPNAFFVDFWCHGVPSAHLWRSFLKWAGKGRTLTHLAAKWRSKTRFGWQQSWCLSLYDGDKMVHASSVKENSPFYHHFLRCNAQNKVCYTCPFGGYQSAADIRVGDFWGAAYAANNTGVSKVALLTPAARALADELRTVCVLEPVAEDVKDLQAHVFPEPPMRSLFIRLLKIDFRLAHVVRRGYDVLLRVKRMIGFGK